MWANRDGRKDAPVDMTEKLARALCLREGWKDADQTAHVREGPSEMRRVRRWEVYARRVEAMLGAIEDAGFVLISRTPDADAWRIATADVLPGIPLGSHDNRVAADRALRIFQALIARHSERK